MEQTELNQLGHFKASLKQIKFNFAKNASGQFQADDHPHHISKHSDIRSHCDDCAGSNICRINCQVTSCAFYPYRNGKNPFHKGNGQQVRGVASG